MAKINQELLGRLMLKLGVGQARAYEQIAYTVKETLLPRHQAALLLASEQGINIGKFASDEDWVAIRSAVRPPQPPVTQPAASTKKAARKSQAAVTARVSSIVANDPFISKRELTAASTNADLYPTLYAFENSIRKLVAKVMESNFGPNWWDTRVKIELQDKVKYRRTTEKDYPWHSRRGADPIYYTDISDLKYIMRKHQKQFRQVLGQHSERVLVGIEDIERTRHILAHNNPVQKQDRVRLTLYAEDWSKLAQAIIGQVV